MLPKRHGFEVCQELKKTPHGTTCPVMIATSVYRGRRYRHQAMHLYSCDAYLEKPLTEEDLLSTVETGLKDYAEARERAAADTAATMEIDMSNLAAEIPVAAPAPAPEAPAEPAAAGMEIDTSKLAAEVPAEPGAFPNGEAQAAPQRPVAQAAAEDKEDDLDFDIVDRLDSLLSDDPSKSSPTRSGK